MADQAAIQDSDTNVDGRKPSYCLCPLAAYNESSGEGAAHLARLSNEVVG